MERCIKHPRVKTGLKSNFVHFARNLTTGGNSFYDFAETLLS